MLSISSNNFAKQNVRTQICSECKSVFEYIYTRRKREYCSIKCRERVGTRLLAMRRKQERLHRNSTVVWTYNIPLKPKNRRAVK